MRSRAFAAVVTACAVYALAYLTIFGTGFYGWALFVGVAAFTGFATTALFALHRRDTFVSAFWYSVASANSPRVTRRTWYEHDLYPSFYWRFWCDLGASEVHRLVLEHLRRETERRRGGMQV